MIQTVRFTVFFSTKLVVNSTKRRFDLSKYNPQTNADDVYIIRFEQIRRCNAGSIKWKYSRRGASPHYLNTHLGRFINLLK